MYAPFTVVYETFGMPRTYKCLQVFCCVMIVEAYKISLFFSAKTSNCCARVKTRSLRLRLWPCSDFKTSPM